MFKILLGSLLLSIVHASIPNHWLPIVAIAKSEKWSRGMTAMVTAVAGASHTLSTIVIGIIIGMVGYKISSEQAAAMKIAAPAILSSLGLAYIFMDLKSHRHFHEITDPEKVRRRTIPAIIVSLSVAMFLSPCLEIEAYFFTAGAHGLLGVLLVSSIYFLVTVVGLIVMVDLARRGVEKIEWPFLERHEKGVTGAVLVVLGVLSYYIISV
jgi:hypothetical protein